MVIKDTIRVYEKVLNSHRFKAPKSFSEDFAIKRFLKKFQEPDPSSNLSEKCFSDWLENDDLPCLRYRRLLPEWYKARALLHDALKHFSTAEFRLPKGSEFIPTRGNNSLEARLCSSDWTVTRDCFPAFSKLCYSHKGFRRAVRRRYHNWYIQRGFDISRRASDKLLWERLGDPFAIFSWKLERVVTFVEGSRFSSVPKNNEARRPINIEPFGNILVQSSIGLGLKRALGEFDIKLDEVPDLHRWRISQPGIATIDLKNASDRISLDLCRFLLPRRVFTSLVKARSPFVLGLDDNYHLVKKISSMGNGFTFELMSLILTAICRVLDSTATVFGDDIIISQETAPRLIQLLEDVGLQVNRDKSFIDGPFRESCGANYHSEEGYIESYDFMWPENIHDCVMILNKCFRLRKYPAFYELYHRLVRCTPPALQGGPDTRFEETPLLELLPKWDGEAVRPTPFPPFFITPRVKRKRRVPDIVASLLRDLSYNPEDFYIVTGFRKIDELRSPTIKDLSNRRHWAKYEMYLYSGRRAKDIREGFGKWVEYQIISSGSEHFRTRTLTN